MNDYFLSDEFASLLTPLIELPNMHYYFNGIVGATLKYYTFLDTTNSFSIERTNEFVKNVVDYVVRTNNSWAPNLVEFSEQYFINETLSKINTKEDQMTTKDKEELVKYFTLVAEKYKYIFHGFNSYFFDSIKEHGINPNVKEHEEDIKKIDEIFSKYGLSTSVGAASADHRKVCYSTTPTNSYSYATRSPEWFSYFCGKNPLTNQENLSNNDLEGAKYCLSKTMDDYKLSQEDRQIVMNFFENVWPKYADKKPMIAIVRKEQQQDILDRILSYNLESSHLDNYQFILSSYDGGIDLKSSEPIDTKNALFIELPRYNELVDKINLLKEETKTR